MDPWDPHHGEGYYYADGTENPAALTDGNPGSATGTTARQIAMENALPDLFAAVEEFPEMLDEFGIARAQSGTGIGIVIGRGRYTAGDTKGDVNSLAVPYSQKINERLTLNLSLPLYYTRVKETDFRDFPPSTLSVWSAGVLLSGAYGVAIPADKKDYRWKVTPTIGLTWMDAGAIDVGQWSLVGGLSSNFLYKIRDGVIFNLGNSLTLHHSQKWRSHYNPLGRQEQALLVNGVQLIFPRERWVFNAFFMDNRYLRDAAVDAYQTYGLGGGYRISRKNSVRLFYYTDQGHDY